MSKEKKRKCNIPEMLGMLNNSLIELTAEISLLREVWLRASKPKTVKPKEAKKE